MTSLKLTIVTPSYNQGIFLERTILSVLNQGIDSLQYLVFDGGSTDNSTEILDKYKGKLSYISKKDNGQSDAVNKGLLSAEGNVIGWLNSDDIYYSGALAKVLQIFADNPEVEVVYGDADHIDEHDRFLEEYYTESWNYERLKEVCYICQPAVFFRKSVVEKYGILNKDLNYCMDYEFWLRVGMKCQFYYIKEKLAGSRLYLDNKTLGNRRAVHEEIILMLKEKFDKVPYRWIYNLSHVITEESGYTRNTPEENYKFVKKLVIISSLTFLKYLKTLPLSQIREMISWVVSAKKALAEGSK